ncbi:hypothetical protein BX666DRAFT_1854342 [Dichotomocladium elegans]|nr:hypothetical protein BX666DRAFT_1854342 [Dichotomocladium elegans]
MDSPFVSNQTSSWLLYILTDSALPTGGFVASSGLEASHQAGLITAANLAEFVTSANLSYASSTSCFVREGYEAVNHADVMARLKECDGICDAVMATNEVARRASLAQGVAMITLYLKCFAEAEQDHNRQLDVGIIKKWKSSIRAEQVDGHFPICFGLVCRYLNVDLENTLHLWLYLFTRTLYSSAVRMNIVGPYEAQRLLLKSREPIEAIIKKTKDMTMDDCCQTNPLLDVCQGMHDRLYTRLFNS